MPVEVGQIIQGRFRIRQHLSATGLGTHHRATDRERDCDVWLRVFGPELLPSASAREGFARAMSRRCALTHRNLAPLREVLFDGDQVVLVFDWMEQGSLATLLARARRAVSIEVARPLLAQVASALEHLHRQGVILGDVELEAIRVVSDEVRLFGMGADALISTRSHAGGGETRFAPELRTGGKLDMRVDVYALAAVAQELITGAAPGMTAPVPLSAHLEMVLGAALADDPAARPSSVAELARDLDIVLSGAPAPTRPRAERRDTQPDADPPREPATVRVADAVLKRALGREVTRQASDEEIFPLRVQSSDTQQIQFDMLVPVEKESGRVAHPGARPDDPSRAAGAILQDESVVTLPPDEVRTAPRARLDSARYGDQDRTRRVDRAGKERMASRRHATAQPDGEDGATTVRPPRPRAKGQEPQARGSARAGADAAESPGSAAPESPGRSAPESPGRAASESPGRAASESPGRAASESPGRAASESPGRAASEPPVRPVSTAAIEPPLRVAAPTQSAPSRSAAAPHAHRKSSAAASAAPHRAAATATPAAPRAPAARPASGHPAAARFPSGSPAASGHSAAPAGPAAPGTATKPASSSHRAPSLQTPSSRPARATHIMAPLRRPRRRLPAGLIAFLTVGVVGGTAVGVVLWWQQRSTGQSEARAQKVKLAEELNARADTLRHGSADPDAGLVVTSAAGAGSQCPLGANLVAGTKPFCVDLYEYPGGRTLPRAGVSYEDAVRLCTTRGERLCSDAEWEHACRGRNGASYPYGSSFEAKRCNTKGGEGELALAGTFSGCRSAAGAYDMSGNVAEWVTVGRDGAPGQKGGSVKDGDPQVRCSHTVKTNEINALVGFRCCADPK